MPDLPDETDILVLDDEPDAANLLAELLRHLIPGAVVRVVHTGEDAVIAGTARCPHSAIFDLEMRGMGGEAAATTLRATQRGTRPLFIALSGNTLSLARLRRSGPFDHLLSKPVDVAALVGLLKNHRQAA